MPLTVENIQDLEQYKSLSTHINGVLIGQSGINVGLQLITTDNIIKLNENYTLLLNNIDLILTAAAIP